VSDVFKALADESRRTILDRLNERSGQSLRELCTDLDMSRQAVSKHLAVLEDANLIAVRRDGRHKLHYLNPVPINEIAERWIRKYDQGRLDALAQLKRALEEEDMEKQDFIYTTYITTTPERLWQALTSPEFTSQYWGLTFDTDWKVGSTMTWNMRDLSISHADQVVLEADPYTRLSYTWHGFPPEWIASMELDDAIARHIVTEPRSRATFTLEPDGPLVKLTVLHEGFDEDSEIIKMISNGWPKVLSSLKTFVESGTAWDS